MLELVAPAIHGISDVYESLHVTTKGTVPLNFTEISFETYNSVPLEMYYKYQYVYGFASMAMEIK